MCSKINFSKYTLLMVGLDAIPLSITLPIHTQTIHFQPSNNSSNFHVIYKYSKNIISVCERLSVCLILDYLKAFYFIMFIFAQEVGVRGRNLGGVGQKYTMECRHFSFILPILNAIPYSKAYVSQSPQFSSTVYPPLPIWLMVGWPLFFWLFGLFDVQSVCFI